MALPLWWSEWLIIKIKDQFQLLDVYTRRWVELECVEPGGCRREAGISPIAAILWQGRFDKRPSHFRWTGICKCREEWDGWWGMSSWVQTCLPCELRWDTWSFCFSINVEVRGRRRQCCRSVATNMEFVWQRIRCEGRLCWSQPIWQGVTKLFTNTK